MVPFNRKAATQYQDMEGTAAADWSDSDVKMKAALKKAGINTDQFHIVGVSFFTSNQMPDKDLFVSLRVYALDR